MSNPIKAPDAYSLISMARTVYGEARGEKDEGRLAVAYVIANRQKVGKWFTGKTIKETCEMPWQFSCWNENDPNRSKLEQASLNDPMLQICLFYSLAALYNRTPDPTFGATHYYNPQLASKPDWADTGEHTVTIGNHEFYRNVA